MKTAKIDDFRDITSTGYVIQRKASGAGRSHRPTGMIFKTSIASHGYRQIRIRGSMKLFHRVLWGAFNGPIPKGFQIDHINGDKTDNNIDNLRLVTNWENSKAHHSLRGGSSRYRGVNWDKTKSKWAARIKHAGKEISCGYHNCETAAALARDLKAISLGWPKEGLNLV